MSNGEQDSRLSKFFFPLRSNVGYFNSPHGYLSLLNRIKQASLLFDSLVFESGVYTATFWKDGSQDFWFPIEQINDEQLEKMRSGHKPVGGEAFFAIQPASGQPVALLSGEVEQSFYCEFHSTLRSLQVEDLAWIEVDSFDLTDQGNRAAHHVQQIFERDLSDDIPTHNSYLKSKIISGLSQDLVLSAAMQAAASIDTLFAPILLQKAHVPPAPGFAALQVAIPDLTHLQWADIVKIREQESLKQFREKLVSLEVIAKSAFIEDRMDEMQYEIALLRAFNQELTRELAARQPKVGEFIGNIVLDLVFGSIPGVSTLMTGIRGGSMLDNANKSWVAAFLKLTPENQP